MENRAGNIRGFTLVEMALVLVVIGIVIGIGAGMIGPLTNLSKTRETKELLGATVESVNSWAASNNSLPNAAGFTSVAKSPNDTWARNVIYLFDNTLYAAAPTKDTICGRKTTQITIRTIDPAATISNVAFVVFSAGDDATIQTTLNNTVAPLPVIAPPTLNGVNFISGNPIPLNTLGFATGTITLDANVSDIVRWVTLDELRSKIGCQGAQLKILNNELPAGSATTAAYAVTVTADGGIPYLAPNLYRWCIQTTTGLTPNVNMVFAPAVFSANCAALAEGSWGQAGQLAISWPLGTAPPSAAYSFTIFVRDNNDAAAANDNVASRAFVLTVNP